MRLRSTAGETDGFRLVTGLHSARPNLRVWIHPSVTSPPPASRTASRA